MEVTDSRRPEGNPWLRIEQEQQNHKSWKNGLEQVRKLFIKHMRQKVLKKSMTDYV